MVLKPQPAQISKKRTGITELPPGKAKTAGTPSLDEGDLSRFIELHGARVSWSRSAICPCENFNSQTQQPDPTCVKCQGRGFFYFGPPNYAVPAEAGKLTSVQKAILADDSGAVIRMLFTRSTHITDPYDLLGTWVRGSMFVTVRPENKIGYYDKIVNLDAEICYSETIKVDLSKDPTLANPIKLRYRSTCINTLETTSKRFIQDADFVLTADGDIDWIAPTIPIPDKSANPDNTKLRFAVHYNMHPTWLIVEYPHVFRETPTRKKIKDKLTPFGTPTPHALQALARLEFLPKTEREKKFT